MRDSKLTAIPFLQNLLIEQIQRKSDFTRNFDSDEIISLYPRLNGGGHP